MRLLAFLLILFAVSCTQPGKTELSQQDKAQMEQEVRSTIADIRDAALHVDTVKLFKLFHFDKSQFLYIETSGAFYDEAAYKAMVAKWYGMINAEVIEKGQDQFRYLDKETVLWSYSGSFVLKFKTGQDLRYSPFGLTMMFKKIDNAWKVVFLQESSQESAATPVTAKS